MTTPRRLLVDPVNACDYHLVSRCVQGAFLCGRDRRTGRDYSHRRQWLADRIKLLACCFAVEVYAYCIMSNHFHLVARYDPLACWRWSDEEVARRWVDAFPPTDKGEVVEERKPEARELLLGDPDRLFRARRTLGSLSAFMKHLKQPIARRANEESGTRGHFFEQRHYSGALLSEAALLAAMAYVDLNPVRAGIAERIEACRETSIAERAAGERRRGARGVPGAAGLRARRGRGRSPDGTPHEAPSGARRPNRRAVAAAEAPARRGTVRCRTRRSASATTSAWCAPWPKRPWRRRPGPRAALRSGWRAPPFSASASGPTGPGSGSPTGSAAAACSSARRRCPPDPARSSSGRHRAGQPHDRDPPRLGAAWIAAMPRTLPDAPYPNTGSLPTALPWLPSRVLEALSHGAMASPAGAVNGQSLRPA